MQFGKPKCLRIKVSILWFKEEKNCIISNATTLVLIKHFTGFIKQYPLRGRPIEQFLTILGVGSYVWNLLQAISESGWDHFKISP